MADNEIQMWNNCHVMDPFGLNQTMGVVAFAGGGIAGLGASNEHARTLSPRQAEGKVGDK